MLKHLLQHIKNACTNIEWYKNVSKIPLSRHLLVFFIVLSFSTVLMTLQLSQRYYSRIISNLSTIQNDSAASGTAVQLEWRDQRLAISDNLIFSLPIFLAETSDELYQYHGLVSAEEIDANQVEDLLNQYSLLIDSNSIYFKNDRTTTIVPLVDLFPNEAITIDKEYISLILSSLLNLLNTQSLILHTLFFIILLTFLTVSRFISLCIDSMLLYLILGLKRSFLPFKTIFIICLNIMIPSELIQRLSNYYPTPFPSLYIIVFWLYFCIIATYFYWDKKKQSNLIVESK